MNFRFLPVLPFFVLLAGCGASRKTASQAKVIDLDTLSITVKRTPPPYRETPPHLWDILHTRLEVSFNIPAREITGRATLRLKPYAGAQDSLFLDAKEMRFSVVSARLGTEALPVSSTQKEGGTEFRFRRQLLPTDTVELFLVYTAQPYRQAAVGGSAIVEERGLYFVNAAGKAPGKPRQIWTQGETESNSHWFPTIDKPNEKFTMELAIQVPDSLITISNGVLFKSEKTAGGALRTDHWKMEQPVQAYAYMMAVGNFASIEDQSVFGKPIVYYVEPQYAPYAKAIFSNTPKMVEFFSDYTGVKYPWPKYSQVAVRDFVSGAMENTSSSLFGEFVNGNARERKDNSMEDVVAHELYHQWFGDYVTAESWNHLTLNESFATDGEILWANFKSGKRVADAKRYASLQRYLAGAQRNDAPLVRNYWDGPDEVFDHISYQKGGQILYYIRQLAGEELFRKAMNMYLQKHAYGTSEAADWRMALEEATGQDWTAFFDQWYYKGGHPRVAFYYHYDDARRQVKVVARQPADSVFKLPIKVGVYNNDPIIMNLLDDSRVVRLNDGAPGHRSWTLNSKSDTLTIPYGGIEHPLIIPDIEHVIVGKVTEQKSDTLWIAQMRLAEDHISQRRAAVALAEAKFSPALAAARLQLLKTQDPALQELIYAILAPEKGADWHTYPGLLEQAELHFRDVNTTPGVRAAALRMWRMWQPKEVVQATVPAFIGDSSYRVGSTALNALVAADSTAGTEAALAVLRRGDARSDLLETALTTVAARGNAADLDLLTKGSETVWGAGKAPYTEALTTYFQQTKDTAAATAAAQKLVQWYGEEEATFVRRRQLYSWEELVQDVQGYSAAEREIIDVRRRILLGSLARLAASESDPGLVKTLADMQKRIQEAARSDTKK